MKLSLNILLNVLVVTSVTAVPSGDREALARLGRRLKEEAVLRVRLEDQLRQTASAEEHRQHLLARKEELHASRMLLEEEVMLLKAEAARQQEELRQAPKEASEVAGTLRQQMQEALDLVKEESDEADAASRRLCEALTEGVGNLRLLCRGLTHETSQKMAKVFSWLEGKLLREAKPGKGTYFRYLPLVLQLLTLWTVWAIIAMVLLLPRRKTCKQE